MNIYLVILLIVAIVLLSNLAMFSMVRGSRGMKVNWLNTTKEGISKPFQKEDVQLNDLRQRVEKLTRPDPSDQPDP